MLNSPSLSSHLVSVVISKSDEQLSLATGASARLEGDDDVLLGSGYSVTAADDLFVTLGGAGEASAQIAFAGTDDFVTAAVGTNLRITGTDDTITSRGSLNLFLQGSDDVVSAKSGDLITLVGGLSDDLISGAGFTVNASSGQSFILGGGAIGTIDVLGSGYSVYADDDVTVKVGGAGASSAAILFMGDEDAVTAANGANLNVMGAHDTITSQGSLNLVLQGSYDTVRAASGDVIALVADSDQDTLLGSGFNVTAWEGLTLTLGGGGASSARIAVTGSDDVLTAAKGTNLHVVGSSDTIASQGSLNLVLNGSDDTVNAMSGDVITFVAASDDDVLLGDGYRVTTNVGLNLLLGGAGASSAQINLTGSENSLTTAKGTNLQVNGSDDGITSLGALNLVVQGSDDVVDALSGDVITLLGGYDDIIGGAGYTVNATGVQMLDLLGGAPGSIHFAGSGNQVTLENSVSLLLQGSHDTISATSGDVVTLLGGSKDVFVGGDFEIIATSGQSFAVQRQPGGGGQPSGLVTIVGGGYTATLGQGTLASVGGAGALATITTLNGQGDVLTIEANSHVAIVGAGNHMSSSGGSVLLLQGSSNLVDAGSGDKITLSGSGNDVIAGLNDTVFDLGNTDRITVLGPVGTLVINGFGADAHGFIDLGVGVGGFANVAAADHALMSDGHGGTLLSLGADGSIDFVGMAKSTLGASHFLVG